MKLAIVADLHFISPDDLFVEKRKERSFFGDAWPSFKRLSNLIREEAPDLVISLGDLVDWYSDENRDMALDFMEDLRLPWLVTPGNHDFQRYELNPTDHSITRLSASEGYEVSKAGWRAKGIELHNRFVDFGGTGLLLMNSAFSDVPPGTREWLEKSLEYCETNLLFTHVPLNIPQVRDYIVSVDPRRSLTTYVQHGAPWVFHEVLKGRVQHIMTGHLHFPGTLHVDSTTLHMLGMGITEKRSNPPVPAVFHTWRSDQPDELRAVSL